MRRSVLAVLPQLLRSSTAAGAPASYQLSSKLQSLRAYADDASLKVGVVALLVITTDSTAEETLTAAPRLTAENGIV